MGKIIYLDNAATTKIKKEVLSSMQPYFLENYGNPSSIHLMGENAYKSITKAREIIAKEINARPWEIIFTSGATESNNLAIKGLLNKESAKRKIIISSIEHPSVSETCDFLAENGYEIIKIPVDKEGILNIELLKDKIDKSTLLVSIIHANNEIGVVQNIGKIGELCRRERVLFHTDAVQSFTKEKIDVVEYKIDMLSASAHKIGGPKGIGFLYVREGVPISPILHGGGQERGLRSGTENVPSIIGFGKAVQVSKRSNWKRIKELRDYFIGELGFLGKLNGSLKDRLADNVHVSFSGIEGENLVIYLSQKNIMCSTGSACSSKQRTESTTLKSIGLSKKEIKGSVRFTISDEITKKDIDYVLKEIKNYLNIIESFKR